MEVKKIYIIGGSVLLTGVVVYGIINTINKKKMIAAIEKILADPTTVNGSPADLKTSPYLDPNYYKTKGGQEMNGMLGLASANPPYWTSLLTRTTAELMAATIFNAYHIFTPNDQAAMITEITQAGSKVKLSYLSSVFLQKYGEPLGDFLVRNLDSNNLAQLQKIINGLS